MQKTPTASGKAIRLVSETKPEGTLVPADQVSVTVDSQGQVAIAIPDGDIPLHPRAVALVAAAMQLEDEAVVAQLVGTLQG
ncbi:MAG: hypothetical protein AAF739_16610 [Pseudomonadota bacterium]